MKVKKDRKVEIKNSNQSSEETKVVTDDVLKGFVDNLTSRLSEFGFNVSDDQTKSLLDTYKTFLEGVMAKKAIEEETAFDFGILDKWNRLNRDIEYRQSHAKKESNETPCYPINEKVLLTNYEFDKIKDKAGTFLEVMSKADRNHLEDTAAARSACGKEDIKEVIKNFKKKNTNTGTHMSTLTPEDAEDKIEMDIYDGHTPYFEMSECSTPTNETVEDNGERVNHPNYYNLKNGPYLLVEGNRINIECIDVIRNMPTWKGNVFKYLWRCGEKQEEGLTAREKELEDMKKALWYLQDKINELEKQ